MLHVNLTRLEAELLVEIIQHELHSSSLASYSLEFQKHRLSVLCTILGKLDQKEVPS